MTTLKDLKASYRVVVKGLVRDEQGRLLLVRERSDTWDLPGGGLDHNEHILPGLEREFEEELQVAVTFDESTLKAYPTWNTKFDDPVLILAYEATIQGEPSVTEDVQEFKYMTLEEAKKAKLDSTLEGIIEKFF